MSHMGGDTGMWDEEDGFFYDVLRLPNGQSRTAQSAVDGWAVAPVRADGLDLRRKALLKKYPELAGAACNTSSRRGPKYSSRSTTPGSKTRRRRPPPHLDFLNEHKLRRVLAKMLDENEFLSEFGIRSLSRFHAEHPYVFHAGGQEYRVAYLPAESDTGMFGGNSNWRGPIWMPVNGLIIRALLQYFGYYGNDFKVECPTGSGRLMTLYQVAEEISNRLANIFLKGKDGRRPVYGGSEKFQNDPHWRDLILFYEYFHGDNGAGLGASHQTGWTGIVARGLHLFATTTAEQVLQLGKMAAVIEVDNPGIELVGRWEIAAKQCCHFLG